MGRNFVLLILSTILFFQCGPENDCPPSTTTSLIVQKSFKDYFPYHPTNKIVFEKYIDTINVGDIDFLIDTFSFIEYKVYSSDCKAGMGQYYQKVYSEHFIFKLVNQKELGKDITLEFKGAFNTNSVQSAYDATPLRISLYNYDNSISSFDDAIVKGNSSNWIDNFIINGKNYGTVYCLLPSWNTRIYLNKQYGIITYLDDSNKMKLIIK